MNLTKNTTKTNFFVDVSISVRDLHQMKLVLRTSGSWHVAKTSCQENGCSCGWGWSSPHLCWLHAGFPYGCACVITCHKWHSVAVRRNSITKKRLKVSTFIYRHLQGNPDQQRFTTRSGVLTGNDRSGAAQVAATYCPNERTLDPTVCSYNQPTNAPASRTMAFTPRCSLATTHYF